MRPSPNWAYRNQCQTHKGGGGRANLAKNRGGVILNTNVLYSCIISFYKCSFVSTQKVTICAKLTSLNTHDIYIFDIVLFFCRLNRTIFDILTITESKSLIYFTWYPKKRDPLPPPLPIPFPLDFISFQIKFISLHFSFGWPGLQRYQLNMAVCFW